MRLTPTEIQIIKDVIQQYSSEYEIYLHGSRLDDRLKGGDIDLFIILPDEIYKKMVMKKHYLEGALSFNLREQKVDVTLISQLSCATHEFFRGSKKIQI